MAKTIFIADLHLSSHTTEFNQLLKQKLIEWQSSTDALYLLGDIFETWYGDDIQEAFAIDIIQALKSFSQQVPTFIMHGNRDFLLGKTFLQNSGTILLNDPSIVKIYQQYYIVTHGDILCTEDIKYQHFRKKVRDKKWQQHLLNQPKWFRKLLAKFIRILSHHQGKKQTQLSITDATEIGVLALKNKFSQYQTADIIHGHTHRPQIHYHELEQHTFKRMVIPDWRPNIHGAVIISPDNNIEYAYF